MVIQFKNSEDFSQKTNDKIKQLVTGEDIGFKWKLGELLKQRGLNANKLAEITGIRNSSLGNYIHNNHVATVNLEHVMAICIALRISDLSELFELTVPPATKTRWTKEVKLWNQNNWQPVYKKGQLDN